MAGTCPSLQLQPHASGAQGRGVHAMGATHRLDGHGPGNRGNTDLQRRGNTKTVATLCVRCAQQSKKVMDSPRAAKWHLPKRATGPHRPLHCAQYCMGRQKESDSVGSCVGCLHRPGSSKGSNTGPICVITPGISIVVSVAGHNGAATLEGS